MYNSLTIKNMKARDRLEDLSTNGRIKLTHPFHVKAPVG